MQEHIASLASLHVLTLYNAKPLDAGEESTMLKNAEHFLEASQKRYQIGNTPLWPVYLTIGERQHTIHLKLEGENPTGSVKDRTGYALVQDLEDRGLLHEESVIIESTSGNLGVALAFQCMERG